MWNEMSCSVVLRFFSWLELLQFHENGVLMAFKNSSKLFWNVHKEWKELNSLVRLQYNIDYEGMNTSQFSLNYDFYSYYN